MLGLIQRVTYAKVDVDGQTIAQIQHGILALIGIEKSDTQTEANRLLDRILTYRIFTDQNSKMNLSLIDISGELLLVPQFTLVADTQTGTRPGFSIAMEPHKSSELFSYLTTTAHFKHPKTTKGLFGADMKITLCNDGPVTFLLSS